MNGHAVRDHQVELVRMVGIGPAGLEEADGGAPAVGGQELGRAGHSPSCITSRLRPSGVTDLLAPAALGSIFHLARRAASLPCDGPLSLLHVNPTVGPGFVNSGSESENHEVL